MENHPIEINKGEKNMNYVEALNYINDKNKFGSRLGLDVIGKLLELLESPFEYEIYSCGWYQWERFYFCIYGYYIKEAG